MRYIEKVKNLKFEELIVKLIYCLLFVSLVEMTVSGNAFTSAEYFSEVSLPMHLISFAALSAFSIILLDKKFDPYICLAVLLVLLFSVNMQNTDYKGIYLALVSAGVMAGFVFYFSKKIAFPKIGDKAAWVIVGLCALFFTLFVGLLTSYKYLSHLTPNFDFGIFAQMFHYMKKDLSPMTTCERDGLLSHFAVHFSPIMYLALPFYALIPSPVTLLMFQALAVGSGAIPLFLLSKRLGLSNKKTVALCAAYALHPVLIGANLYYFHENCFLAPLLLWLFYFLEKDAKVSSLTASGVFALAVCLVKEDAPVYIFFIGLYFLFSGKGKRRGLALMMLAAAYFLFVTSYLSANGEGIMAYRYGNYIFEKDGSIYSVVINLIKNPSYLLTQLMKAEKLEFLLFMTCPLAFIPFAIKKPSGGILLLPMILINFMTEYKYQYDIGFQYTYASVAFLFYLSAINLTTVKGETAKKLLVSAFAASLIFFASTHLTKLPDAVKYYGDHTPVIESINEGLDSIDKDKSVTATTWLVPALWDRDTLYQFEYTENETDVYVFDLRFSLTDKAKAKIDELTENGYKEVYRVERAVVIYEKN